MQPNKPIFIQTSRYQDDAVRKIFGVLNSDSVSDIYEAHARIAKFIPRNAYNSAAVIVKHEDTEYLVLTDGTVIELETEK